MHNIILCNNRGSGRSALNTFGVYTVLHEIQHAHRFFHLGVHVPFTFIFGGAMYPLTLQLGVQRK